MSTKETSLAGALLLTPNNYDHWRAWLTDTLQPLGPEGVSILERVKPVTLKEKPDLDQLRSDADGNLIDNEYKFKTIAKDKHGADMLNAQGQPTYVRLATHWADYEKAKSIREADIIRVLGNTIKCNIIITGSISEKSRDLMKAVNIERYNLSLKDPVEILKLIDETHKIHNDAGIINTFKNFVDCRQSNYNGDYNAFMAEYSKFQRELMQKTNPLGKTDATGLYTDLIDLMSKAYLVMNCDRSKFKYIIDKVNTDSATTSYSTLVIQMTNYAKNDEAPSTSKTLINIAQKDESENKSGKTIKIKCPKCEYVFYPRELSSGGKQKVCNRCYFEKKKATEGEKKADVSTDGSKKKTFGKPKYNNSERVKEEQEKQLKPKQLMSQRTENLRNIQTDGYEEYEGDDL